ncbi:hypothetical protein CALVIDRAFT_119441 [Calocera viscosa TUFC12733]|uniref:Uncharacterized protein n=1 Tax=Calocera viscosa (strain TUFC12733) TaxID=1330018 RepID=A0A167MA09_CALVF|nr:hypothetical protein CALVIDRAFT_119441 [Calocera viscosa TUFC12733]
MSRGTRDQEDIDEDEEDDEQEALERFFLEREFEYVDADSNSHDHDDRQEEGLHNDVTGLRRVLDSLSTVMWPSMVRLPARPGLALGGSGPSSALSWEEDVEEEEEDEDAEVEAHVAAALQALGKLAVGRDTFEGRLAQAKYQEEAGSEREALEMWLEEGVQPSEARSREELGAEGKEEEFGQLVGSGSVGKGWAELEEEENGSGEGYAALEEDEEGEDGLPSEGEILRAHLEIFGPPPPPASSSAVLIPAARSTEPPVDPEHAGQTFDLSSALGALQSMRDEIRGMTDERERRRAAARVALGLVHGLGLEEGDLDEVMRHA